MKKRKTGLETSSFIYLTFCKTVTYLFKQRVRKYFTVFPPPELSHSRFQSRRREGKPPKNLPAPHRAPV